MTVENISLIIKYYDMKCEMESKLQNMTYLYDEIYKLDCEYRKLKYDMECGLNGKYEDFIDNGEIKTRKIQDGIFEPVLKYLNEENCSVAKRLYLKNKEENKND